MSNQSSVTFEEPPKEIIHRGPYGMDEEQGSITATEDETISPRSSTSSTSSSGCLHMLTSTRAGDSKVERMARRIDRRIRERVQVTFHARKTFLKRCRSIAIEKGYLKKSRIKYSDIKAYHADVRKDAEDNDAEGIVTRAMHFMGILSDVQCLEEMLAKAEEVGQHVQMEDDDDFYFQEFNFFHTVLVSRWPFVRFEFCGALLVVFGFYLMTPILFCLILEDTGICPQDAKVAGWVSALYFASTTMSTVGYGDLSVEKDEAWKVVIGMLYMIASTGVALFAFSAAAKTASSTSPVKRFVKWIARISPVSYPEGPLQEGEFLYQRIRKIKWIAIGDVALQFIALNLVGVIASQAFIEFSEMYPDRQWNWVDSLYWAVQTTTTIGYGDLAMPDHMRWFQIFYLSLATYFTGNALGRLSALREDLEKTRRYHNFERRQVNKYMMHYLSSTGTGRVDQYEFVIASLLNLGKVDADDIDPIMDKFRSLERSSGGTGYISVRNCPEESDTTSRHVKCVEGAL